MSLVNKIYIAELLDESTFLTGVVEQKITDTLYLITHELLDHPDLPKALRLHDISDKTYRWAFFDTRQERDYFLNFMKNLSKQPEFTTQPEFIN
jgi:hypothetical protein